LARPRAFSLQILCGTEGLQGLQGKMAPKTNPSTAISMSSDCASSNGVTAGNASDFVDKVKKAGYETNTAGVAAYMRSQGMEVKTKTYDEVEKSGDACFTFKGNHIERGGVVITQTTGGCFPGDAVVQTKDKGPLRMLDLKIGENVQAYDVQGKRMCWSKVTTFLHRDPEVDAAFKEVETAEGFKLRATPDHRIFADDGDAYMSTLVLGSKVVVPTVLGACTSVVTKVVMRRDVGVFMPLTAEGTIVVDGVACSCHAVVPHSVGNVLFSPLRLQWMGRLCNVNDGLNGYVKMMVLPILVLASALPQAARVAILSGDSPLWDLLRLYEQGALKEYAKVPLSASIGLAFIVAMLILLWFANYQLTSHLLTSR